MTGTILRKGTGLQKPLAEGKVSVLFLLFFFAFVSQNEVGLAMISWLPGRIF